MMALQENQSTLSAKDSLICKLAAKYKDYLEDEFIEGMFEKVMKQIPDSKTITKLPIINRGYYARIKSFEVLISSYITTFPVASEIQIVNIGCGFDTISLKLSSHFKSEYNLSFFEIDFKSVIDQKFAIIHSNEVMTSSLSFKDDVSDSKLSDTVYKIGNLIMIGCDIRSKNMKLIDLLRDNGFDATKPTIILTECVLVYLEKEITFSLIKEFSKSIQESFWITYDMLNPNDIFGQTMLRNISCAGYEVPGFTDFPSVESLSERFSSLNWENVKTINMLQAYNKLISSEEKVRVNKLQIFDEIEEWELLMSHYSLTIAVNTNHESIKKIVERFPLLC